MTDYLAGFGNAFSSEALPGAVPAHQNSPRKPPYGLYAEQLNGTPFTVQRAANRRTWLYRIRPSSVHGPFSPYTASAFGDHTTAVANPNVTRWKPLEIPPADTPIDLIDGMVTFGGAGDPVSREGLAIHLYAANASMGDKCFHDADGDLLLVPQSGRLAITTELGHLDVAPGELFLLPRGLRMSVALPDGAARGYCLETYGRPLRLPERGPLGANGLADARHFLAPVAAYEHRDCPGYQVVVKYGGTLWRATQDHSPFDVVGWHGNCVPFKYDMMMFNAYGSATWDHPDPSIHTVLTAPYDDHGAGLADVIAFRGRWDPTETTFRPPYFHRNAATEFNGIVKRHASNDGFVPGCYFLTPMLSPHGVITRSVDRELAQADAEAEAPLRLPDESLWFMFESCMQLRVNPAMLAAPNVDAGFRAMFDGVTVHFDPAKP